MPKRRRTIQTPGDPQRPRRDDRGNDRERGRGRPRTEWKPDDKIGDRKDQMMEKARELKCVEATQVLFGMLRALEGFTRMANIYAGPSRKDMAEQESVWGKGHQAREQAWYQVRERHARFDPQDAAGASDWLRAVEVFKQAMDHHVFDARPPQGKDDEPSEEWQEYSQWCQEHNLNAQGLSRVAYRLSRELDSQTLPEKLEAASTAQMDQVIMAGYGTEDIFVNDMGIFKTLESQLVQLDPEYQKELYEKARAAALKEQKEYLKGYAIYLEHRKQFRLSGQGTYYTDRFNESKRIYSRVFDEIYEAGTDHGLVIARQSAACNRQPRACLVAQESKEQPKEEWQEPAYFGHGVHALSGELIKVLVGPEKLEEVVTEPEYSYSRGEITRRRTIYLVKEHGPVLSQEEIPQTGPEAASLFLNALIEDKSTVGGIKLGDELKFLWGNRNLLENEIPRLLRRAAGQIPEPAEEFDLRQWYQEKLTALGNVSSVAEAKKHTTELTLTLDDVIPGQQAVVEKLDRDRPTQIELNGRTYPVEYADGQAIIHISPSARENFLTLAPEMLPFAIEFRYQGGFDRDYTSGDLEYVQDYMDQRYLEDQWKAYNQKDFEQEIPNMLQRDPFPQPAELLDQSFPAYCQAKNGRDRFPAPGIEYSHAGFYIKLYPIQHSADQVTKYSQERYQSQRERQARVDAADPAIVAQVERLRAEVHAARQACSTEDIFFQAYAGHVDRYIPEANRALDDGRADDALVEIQRAVSNFKKFIEGRWEQFQQAQELLREINALGHAINAPELDTQQYLPRRLEGSGKTPPSREQMQRTIERLEEILAKRQVRKKTADQAAQDRQDAFSRFEGLDLIDRADEAVEYHHQIDELMNYFDRETRPSQPVRFKFQKNTLADLRRDYYERANNQYQRDLRNSENLRDLYDFLEDLKYKKKRLDEELAKIIPQE